ncbi:MAG: steryl acetyl hydrolase [Sphingobacteriales bacterium]|nr:MAG: steryl acetyl hydrolase [Sphingobacteriales bacterium]
MSTTSKLRKGVNFAPTKLTNDETTPASIPLHLYNPAHRTGLPIIISFHPGGFVTPFQPFMQYECWRQAKVYNALVIAVDYRIAPAHRYPAAVDDAYAAFKWVLRNGQRYGGDTSRMMVLGLSAGGNLAAVVCQKAKKDSLIASGYKS